MLLNAQKHNTSVYVEPTRTKFGMAFSTGYTWRSNTDPIVELTDPSCAKNNFIGKEELPLHHKLGEIYCEKFPLNVSVLYVQFCM